MKWILKSLFYLRAALWVFTAMTCALSCARKKMEKELTEEIVQTAEAAILSETEKFAMAWSEGDAKKAASFYTEDGVRVGAFGDRSRGRAEIEEAYRKLLQETMPGARLKQEKGEVRRLTDDLALWQGGIEISLPGNEPPLKGYVVQVMKKTGNRWLVLEAHPKLSPPPKK